MSSTQQQNLTDRPLFRLALSLAAPGVKKSWLVQDNGQGSSPLPGGAD